MLSVGSTTPATTFAISNSSYEKKKWVSIASVKPSLARIPLMPLSSPPAALARAPGTWPSHPLLIQQVLEHYNTNSGSILQGAEH